MNRAVSAPRPPLRLAVQDLCARLNDPDHHDIFSPGARLKEVKPVSFKPKKVRK